MHICPPPSTEIIYPWTPLETMEKTDYDVIIVGTGPGGGSVLWRLAEQWGDNGKRIGIVEVGDNILPAHKNDLPNWKPVWANIEPPSPLYYESIPVYPSDQQGPPSSFISPFLRFLALGGRSIKWGVVSPRMSPIDLAGWPISPKEMDMYYNIAEEIMKVNTSYYKTALFLQDRLRRNGFPETTSKPAAVNVEPPTFGAYHGTPPRFTTLSLLADAASRRPFDISIKTRAVQVYAEQGKVAGLRVMNREKKSYFLKTKAVVLATSALETPRLLLYSGFQGEAIGHYLTSHSKLYTLAKLDPTDYPKIPGLYGIYVPRTIDRPYQMQMRGFPPSGETFDILGSGVIESRFVNRVAIDPLRVDEYGVPKTVAYFSFSNTDLEVIRKMEAGMRQAAEAMKVTIDPICMHHLGLGFHDIGTCRIGTNPSTSAANPYGQIHGISGLYVADSSMLPTAGAANPFLTIVALSIRTADYIIEQMK
jgi:choline dehydrogenase-like flavoprotein